MKLMKLTIVRSMWIRGGGQDSKLLREEDNKRCCLGFLAAACGLIDEAIREVAEPGNVSMTATDAASEEWTMHIATIVDDPDEEGYEDGPLVVQQLDLAERLIAVNDDAQLSEEDREDRIARLMSVAGVEVEYVD
jgi:hypothetical protein